MISENKSNFITGSLFKVDGGQTQSTLNGKKLFRDHLW